MIRCTVEDVIFLKSPEAIRCGSTAFTVSVFPAISVSQGEPEGCSEVADSAVKRSGETGCSLIGVSSERYIVSSSSSNQSGLICGKLSRIFRSRSYPGLLRPEMIWEILEAPVPRISARRLEVNPSLFISLNNFSPIFPDFFTNINIFIL